MPIYTDEDIEIGDRDYAGEVANGIGDANKTFIQYPVVLQDPDNKERGAVLTQQQICDVMNVACELCKYPSEYKDPDDLAREHCNNCPVFEILWEFNENGDKRT